MKAKIFTLAQIVISVLLLSFLYKGIELDDFNNVISQLSWFYICLCFGVNVCGVVFFNSLQVYLHSVLSGEIRSFKNFMFIFRTDFVFRFFSLFLPLVGSAGLKLLRYKKYGFNLRSSLDLVVVNKLLQLLLILLACLSFFPFDHFFWENKQEGFLETILWAFFVITFSFFLLYVFFGKKIILILLVLASKLPKLNVLFSKLVDRLGESSSLRGGSFSSRSVLIFWATMFLLQLVSVLVVSYSQYLLFGQIGIDLGFVEAVVLRCVVLAAMLVPISYAGMGFRELGTVGVLSSVYGVQATSSLALATILLAYQLLISMMGAFIYLVESLRPVLAPKA